MRVPLSWLRAYCDPGLSTEEIGHRLAMSGTEPERIERVGIGSTENFVIGRVDGAVPHPDADRLKVCVVDVGEDDSRTIVCGAPNVTAGQTVAVALPGAVLANGQELGEVELRGVKSSGMILAEDEVGLGEDHAGIMVLPDGPPPGAPLTEHLPIADNVLDLEVNPNRPDCLAVYGVARELHAVTGAPLAEDPTDEDAEPRGSDQALAHASVEIDDPEICLRFTARVFEDVKIGPSPMWLKARLIAAGQRPISNVVDITNYVMLLTGQPLHAFDLDEVRGDRIVVRRARAGERMTTLDGVERTFDESMALVCDAEGPSGIAGIMGGEVSEVSEKTTRVLMEAATWVGTNILQTSSKLGLRSEASTRFEKQLHPELAMAAQRLAARLMVELCGARLVPGTLDAYPSPTPTRTIRLHLDRLEKLLGEEIKGAQVHEILQRLGFPSHGTGAGFEVTVPYWRDGDVQREVDLIEEVARVHGLENLPVTLPARRRAVGRLTREQRIRRRLEDALRDRGLSEIVAYSFTAPDVLSRLGVGEGALPLANPLSEDASVMRPLLLPGLLDAARHNTAHGRPDVALFESAHVYRPGGSLEAPEGSPRGATPAAEEHHLAALLTQADPGSWRSEPKPADFYAARALVEAVLETAGVEWRAEPAERTFLHPGRAAEVIAGANGEPIGWIGEIHPGVARDWDLEPAAAFELDAEAIARLAPEIRQFTDVTSFPPAIQDIAVVVPDDVSAASVEEAVRVGGGDLLAHMRVFDLYRGEQVGAGGKSLALRLEFQAPDRTLTDEEVAERRAAIEAELERIGGKLRA